jgi:hypothetical protein
MTEKKGAYPCAVGRERSVNESLTREDPVVRRVDSLVLEDCYPRQPGLVVIWELTR